jgi:NitT/TauT family transport system ATP-binding protein
MSLAQRSFIPRPDRTAVRVANVTKRYRAGTITAVEDICLDLPENRVTAFLGPSGCGKTTMLRMIAGLEHPTTGVIEARGEPIRAPGPDRGMIFQGYTSFPWLTARGNVEYGLKLLGVASAERRDRAVRLLRRLRLDGFADSYPRQLSGGMQQRVAIARTLAQDPAILLLDEPFGALDAQVRWEMQEMLIGILEHERKTVVLVTHDIQESLYLADSIAFFTRNPGRIRTCLPLAFKGGRRFRRKEEVMGLPGYRDTEQQLFAWMRAEIRRG